MSHIRLEKEGAVGVLTMERKERFNALDVRMAQDFRAGGVEEELHFLAESRPVPAGFGERFKQILEYIHSTISEMKRAPKPVICALDGVAAAGGFGIAMAGDLVVCSERAVLEWAYGKTALTG